MLLLRNCNACKNINITEKEQKKQVRRHTSHACTKYDVVLFHESSNPKILSSFIYPCDKCKGKHFDLKEGIEYAG